MESYEEVVKEICTIYVFGEKGSPQAFSKERNFYLYARLLICDVGFYLFPHWICLLMNYSQPATAAITRATLLPANPAWIDDFHRAVG